MENKELYELLSKQIENIYTDLSNKIENVNTDLSNKIENVNTDLSNKIENLNNKFNKLEKRVTSIEHSLVVIENDHGNMLSALFDNLSVNEDRNKENQKNFKIINQRLENHSIRIANIEDSVKKLLNQNK